MKRLLVFSFLFVLLTSFNSEKTPDSWIGTNQLVNFSNSPKVAAWISKADKLKNYRLIDSATTTGIFKDNAGRSFGKRVPGDESLKKTVTDQFGAIIRGDTTKKMIALVFTGDEFADGGAHIRKTLRAEKVKSSFFLTGRFYSNKEFKPIIQKLKADGHYLGAHSDDHLLYCDWVKRDSLLVTQQQFSDDLKGNYRRMEKFGILKADAPYFLPPYEWYNASIVDWTAQQGLRLVNFSPGTRSTADYTYPQLGKSYRSSNEIYESIVNLEKKDPNGLNGFILLVHIGTDPRRTDKFYLRLQGLIKELKGRGYAFERIDEMLN